MKVKVPRHLLQGIRNESLLHCIVLRFSFSLFSEMTEDEQFALALKMSEQEARQLNSQEEEEEELLRKAIAESLGVSEAEILGLQNCLFTSFPALYSPSAVQMRCLLWDRLPSGILASLL